MPALNLIIMQQAKHIWRRLGSFDELDLDGDGELTLEDSKLASSKVTPFVKRRPILSGGFATGFALGYGMR